MNGRYNKPVQWAGAVGAAMSLALIAAPVMAATTSSGLVVDVDTVSTHGCVQTNVFERGGDSIVWRIAVLDHSKEDKTAMVAVHVVGGPTIKAAWTARDGFYTAALPLAFNAKTGVVHYSVTATVGKTTLTYQPPFLVPPSELMVVPYPYSVTVAAGNGKIISFAAKATIPIKAAVTYSAENSSGKMVVYPMTAGTVQAAIGLESTANSQGLVKSVKSVALHYQAASKAWVGTVSTAGLKAGVYEIDVNAKDKVSPPNTGTGTSMAFNLG